MKYKSKAKFNFLRRAIQSSFNDIKKGCPNEQPFWIKISDDPYFINVIFFTALKWFAFT